MIIIMGLRKTTKITMSTKNSLLITLFTIATLLTGCKEPVDPVVEPTPEPEVEDFKIEILETTTTSVQFRITPNDPEMRYVAMMTLKSDFDAFESDEDYINDDKPFIRYNLQDNKFYVYGTPWMGKHNLGANVKVPLKAICFLNRGETNSITKINSLTCLNEIMAQTVQPTSEEAVAPFMDTISLLTQKVDFYKLYCNISKDAATTSFNGMINN